MREEERKITFNYSNWTYIYLTRLRIVDNMWPDLQKGVFRTHPIYQLWWLITFEWKRLLTWNLVKSEHQHSLVDGKSFRLMCFLSTELWFSEFIELDVCGRPLFANPFTYHEVLLQSSMCRETQDTFSLLGNSTGRAETSRSSITLSPLNYPNRDIYPNRTHTTSLRTINFQSVDLSRVTTFHMKDSSW